MEYTSQPGRPFVYVLVTPEGQLSIESGTFQDMRHRTFDGHKGSNEIVDLPALYPVAAYCSVAYQHPDQRRMNKVANGMVWELSLLPERSQIDPDRDDVLDAYTDPPRRRVVKMQGPVVFFERIRSLADEEITALQETHEVVYNRLKVRGWI